MRAVFADSSCALGDVEKDRAAGAPQLVGERCVLLSEPIDGATDRADELSCDLMSDEP
jgi:hypothetical protein